MYDMEDMSDVRWVDVILFAVLSIAWFGMWVSMIQLAFSRG